MDGWRPVEPAALEDGTPLAMSQLAQALCDSEIGRIVLSADGLPLDLGRTQRLYTGQQRRAIIVRDRACAWNGCDVPAAYCQVHHIRWWDRDHGTTSVDNGVLLCTHHHHVVHQHDLHIQRLTRPPTTDPPILGNPPTTDSDAATDTPSTPHRPRPESSHRTRLTSTGRS